jgi:hypothetical protein
VRLVITSTDLDGVESSLDVRGTFLKLLEPGNLDVDAVSQFRPRQRKGFIEHHQRVANATSAARRRFSRARNLRFRSSTGFKQTLDDCRMASTGRQHQRCNACDQCAVHSALFRAGACHKQFIHHL